MANTNSYAESMKQLSNSVAEMMSVANAVNESIMGNEEYAIIDGSTKILSNQYILNRLERTENTVAQFTQGKGIVETDDGTYRKIRVDAVSRPPENITDLTPITSFGIDPNWFFENFQYPRCVVHVSLKDKIDDDSDRVYVDRIIIDASQYRMTDQVKSDILGTQYSYGEMIEYLDKNMIEYREDKDEVKLPLTYEKYLGKFQVTGTTLIKNPETGISENWYYLSTINYSTVDEAGSVKDNGNVLSEGDYLRFDNSLFRISEINQLQKRVKLEYSVGYEAVGLYDYLELYNDPFSEKTIEVGIGIDEIDVIYVKGVNENYNLMAREWSNPIAIYTNDLTFDEDDTVNFARYYTDSVADFGKRLIAQAKEGHIPAYGGIIPNTPVLNADDMKVVQINTQLNVTLDKKKYTNLTSEIASVKSNISAIRTTISANKDKLIKESNPNSRENVQNTINSDTEKMNNLTTQFSSLVEELNTMLTDAGAIGYEPKYHIRGFVTIPEPQYSYNDGTVKTGKQSVIGFETMYRYLHTDETGVALNKFTYRDGGSSAKVSGTFSDWNLSVSQFLEKKYNSKTDSYEWSDVRMDGSSVSINQIDIPIRNGEKVEIKVRSVSEAGYPYCPLKSEWSNSIIISFPNNLTSDDSVTKILDTVKSDMTSVVLQETMSSAGVYSHMSDMNSQYKHDSQNIEYTDTVTDSENGTTTTLTLPLSEKIKSMVASIKAIATSLGMIIDEHGNITAIEETALEEAPSIDYKFKDGSSLSEYSGSIIVRTPNLTNDERASVNSKLLDFLDGSVFPYITRRVFSVKGDN